MLKSVGKKRKKRSDTNDFTALSKIYYNKAALDALKNSFKFWKDFQDWNHSCPKSSIGHVGKPCVFCGKKRYKLPDKERGMIV